MDNLEGEKILLDLVKFNTIEDKENSKIIDYIEETLKNLGFTTDYKEKYLIMHSGNNCKIGFLGHTDTTGIAKGWNTNPFDLTKIDNKLYGLGSCDMKGGIAAFITAISQINPKKLKHGIKVYFSYDEEIGFKGINEIIKLNQEFPELLIIGEATNNEFIVGSKGLLEYEIEFNGVEVHSSIPDKGISANLNAIKFLNELQIFYNNDIKKIHEPRYDIPYTTMNIGLINGGRAINTVSPYCRVCFDFRIANGNHIELIKSKVNELCSKYNCKQKILNELKPFINETDFIESKKTANYITEASFINDKNIQKIILGPGPINGHEINEYITVESFKNTVQQYLNLINKTCV